MAWESFFQRVWRVNAILILAAGFLACIVLVFAIREIAIDAFRTRQVEPMVRTDGEGVDELTGAFYSGFRSVEGHPVVRASLLSRQTYDVGAFSKETAGVRNFLFLHTGRKRAHWLVDKSDALFVWDADVVRDDADDRRVMAMLYHVISEDTNDDQRLTPADLGAIAISAANGEDYRILVDGVSSVDHVATNDDGSFVIYRKGARLRVAEIETRNLRLVDDRPLPKAPALSREP